MTQIRVTAVKPLQPYRLRITWNTGETAEVDVGAKLKRNRVLAPILEPVAFRRAHVAKGGAGVEWFDTEFGADNLLAWAREQQGLASHEMIWDWMHRNNLTLDAAAEALGISRRMLAYYRSAAKPVPKTVWLACLGWEATQKRKAA